MNDDTISRAAAIDAVNNMIRRKFGISADLGTGALLELPSATDTNVGGNLIDRQAALDAIKKLEKPAPTAQHLSAIFDCEDTIKALPSAQPTGTNTVQVEDCISRAAIVDAIEGVDWYHMTDSGEMVHGANSAEHQAWYKAEDIYAAIEALPSAQPGWIPCTPETMPKNKSNVLTVIYIPGRQAHIRSGWYEDGLFMNDNGDTWKATDKEVVGWMYQPKLPKPWEGDANG